VRTIADTHIYAHNTYTDGDLACDPSPCLRGSVLNCCAAALHAFAGNRRIRSSQHTANKSVAHLSRKIFPAARCVSASAAAGPGKATAAAGSKQLTSAALHSCKVSKANHRCRVITASSSSSSSSSGGSSSTEAWPWKSPNWKALRRQGMSAGRFVQLSATAAAATAAVCSTKVLLLSLPSQVRILSCLLYLPVHKRCVCRGA
jgi:hypothetical protein